MALDEPKDGDTSIEVAGITWLVSERDAPQILGGDGVRVDHRKEQWGAWFNVTQLRQFGGGGGCC